MNANNKITELIEISIIIVNYNTADFLRNCLRSIEEKLIDFSYEVIVVDNDSPRRNIEELPSEFPTVRFILRKENDGFGSGCNYGAGLCSGKYLLFLNPDIILIDDSVKKLKDYLDKNPNCGIVSGLLVDENSSVLYCFNDFPSFMWEFYHLIGYGYDEKIHKLINKKEIINNEKFETDWFHGAYFMINKDYFFQTGGFNENYFIYYEDVELCYKSKKIMNRKNICIPDSRVFHHTKSSLVNESMDNIYIFHLQRSKILFYKNYSFFKRLILNFTGIMYVLIRIIFLPVWSKYKCNKMEKFNQLRKILKLYFSSVYLKESKYEYIK